MEAGVLVETAAEMLSKRPEDVGRELHFTLEYLRSTLAIGSWTEASDLAKVEEDRDSLEGVFQQANGTVCDILLQSKFAVLRGHCRYRHGMLDPSITVAMVDLSINILGRAHGVVNAYGDIRMELKVLRGLERGYLAAQSREKVAQASLTIMRNREKRLAEAVQTCLADPMHAPAIQWDLGSAVAASSGSTEVHYGAHSRAHQSV